MARWWEHSPPANVARVRFPDSASYVGWVFLLVLVLAPWVFSPGYPVSPLLKNQHFQIPIRSGLLSSILSWASGSGDCASTLRVIDKINYFTLPYIYLITLRYQNISPDAYHNHFDSFVQISKRKCAFFGKQPDEMEFESGFGLA